MEVTEAEDPAAPVVLIIPGSGPTDRHRESMGVDVMRMREVKTLMDRRIEQGHGDQGFSSLYEILDTSKMT